MKNLFKKIWIYLLLGLIIRLLLMPITLHPDIWAISFSQYFFSFKGIFNIYDYLGNLPGNSAIVMNYGRNFFTYPPLAYFTLGIFGLLLKPLFNADFVKNLAVNLPDILNNQNLYWHLFLTKLPYLFFDFGVLWFLLKLFDDERKKIIVAILWLFNPLSLYTSFMIGQFDIIPVFFTILALYLTKEKKLGFAVFCLGIGGAFKMFPLFFIPILAFNQSKNIKTALKLIFIGFIPYFVSIIPFIGSPIFRQTVLLSNQSQKMLFMKLPVSGAEYLSVFLVIYVFILIYSAVKKTDLWKFFSLVMLLLFSITHYHPQWFLWLTPFLVIFWVEYHKFKVLPIVLLASWLIITLLFEPSLSIQLFVPVNGTLLQFKPLSDQINTYYNIFDFKSLIRSIAAGVSLAMSILLFRNENTA